MRNHCLQGYRSSQLQGIAIGSSAERGKNYTCDMILFRQIQTTLIGTAQKSLILWSTLIDRSYGVKNISGGHLARAGNNSATSRTATYFPTLIHDNGSCRSMNGPIHTATTCQGSIGR